MIPTDAIVIRHARRDDARALDELAILDSRSPLTGDVLIAEVDGVARAALSMEDAQVVADPFARTAELVELLRVRARRLEQAACPYTTSRRSRVAAALRRPRRAATARA